MKVLLINSVCGIGSTGRICTDIAKKLEAKGHSVRIAYGRDSYVPDQYRKYAFRIGNDVDVRVHGIKSRLIDGAGFGSKRATRDFLAWVREYDPDVIHLHNLHGYYLNIEVLFDYLKTCGKRIIWTLHDSWAFTGHSAYCDAIGCTKWKAGCFKCPEKNNYPKSFFDNSKYNWNKKRMIMQGVPNLELVTPSYWLADLTRESFLADYPITVIHNGIDTSNFHPTNSSFKEDTRTENKIILLGVASSWDDMKGLSDFIYLSELIDPRFQIILVGLSKMQKKKCPRNIIAIEKTNNLKELACIYSAADIFLNLSYCENYPTVNLEALACGTPVLTYDVGGSKESALNCAKYAVKRGSVKGIRDNIDIILRDMEKKPLTVDIEKIDSSRTVDGYVNLYERIGKQ